MLEYAKAAILDQRRNSELHRVVVSAPDADGEFIQVGEDARGRRAWRLGIQRSFDHTSGEQVGIHVGQPFEQQLPALGHDGVRLDDLRGADAKGRAGRGLEIRRRLQAILLEHEDRVLDAAEELFVRDGYGATTITAIADAADVAVQTVYAVFGTKRAVLTELLVVRTVGADQPGQARADMTPATASVRDTHEVLVSAAGSDLEIAELYRQQQQARYRDRRRLARWLARRGVLRLGLNETRATDVMWTLANPRTYHSLVHERGWKPADYERWLADLLCYALLGESGADDVFG